MEQGREVEILQLLLVEVQGPAHAVRVLGDPGAVAIVVVEVGVERGNQDIRHVGEEVALGVAEVGVAHRNRGQSRECGEGVHLAASNSVADLA